jgi:hypothetical protein
MKSKLCKAELDIGNRNMTAREANPNTEQDTALLLTTELLILPDGRILVHNLTQPFAELLLELNPNAEQITPRLAPRASHPDHHELPN